MPKKVLLFFPQNPYPPESGFHRRGLSLIEGLRELGCRTWLASSTLSAYPCWQASSIEKLKAEWVADVHVHEPSRLDLKFIDLLARYYDYRKKEPPVDSRLHTPPGMRRWFARLVDDLSPDVIIMNYARWDGLIRHRRWRSVVRVLDSIDLMTLNLQMWHALEDRLPPPPIRCDAVGDDVLREDFFRRLGLSVRPEEFRVCDRYTYTIAITAQEADLIQRSTRRTKVLQVPMTQEPVELANRYDGPALFTTGPNPFNVQGYLYFVKRVLPHVRRQAGSFRLQVTGHVSTQVSPEDGVVLSGFVPDLQAVFESARFLICPVFGLTGQQVKIVEAMAHGVPAVALRVAAERSPMRHEVNGLVADSAEEFADQVLRLWHDPELCRRLGQAAQETIRSEFSRSRLLEALSVMVNHSRQDARSASALH